MITIPDALQALRPGAQWILNGDSYDGLEWLDTVQQKPTEEEVTAMIAALEAQAPLDACVAKAKELLVATDWAMLADVAITNRTDFITYRAAVRDAILHPVPEPIWPTEPQPVWGIK